MLKRKLLMLFTLVIAIGVLFTAPAVMAEWPAPPPIYDNLPMTATIEVPKSGTYTITAEVIPGTTCIEGAVPCDQYKLTFAHSTGDLSGLNAIYLTTPRWNEGLTQSKYCSEPLTIVEVSDEWQRNQSVEVMYELGGRDAMQWTHMSGSSYWFIGLNKIELEDLVPGTVCVKDGRYFRCAAIAVFDCPRPDCESPTPLGASLPAQCVVLLNGTEANNPEHEIAAVYYQTDQSNVPIISSIKFHATLDCSDVGKPPDSVTADDTVYSTGGPGQPNISFTVSISSPAFIEFWTGSYWVRFEY